MPKRCQHLLGICIVTRLTSLSPLSPVVVWLMLMAVVFKMGDSCQKMSAWYLEKMISNSWEKEMKNEEKKTYMTRRHLLSAFLTPPLPSKQVAVVRKWVRRTYKRLVKVSNVKKENGKKKETYQMSWWVIIGPCGCCGGCWKMNVHTIFLVIIYMFRNAILHLDDI